MAQRGRARGMIVERLEDRALLAGLVGHPAEMGAFENVYTRLDSIPPSLTGASAGVQVERYMPFSLDRDYLESLLQSAPLETTAAPTHSEFLVSIPAPDGNLQTFDVVESPVMAPELAAQFPQIKTYVGQGVTDPAATIRFDLTPLGFHAQVLSPNGAYYVDPYYHLEQSAYVSYYRSDRGPGPSFEEEVGMHMDGLDDGLAEGPQTGGPEVVVSRRDIRTTVTTTTSYNSFFGNNVTNVLSAVTTAINRVTGVYEVDLAIRLVLVANTTRLFSGLSGPGTDNPNGTIAGGSNVSTLSSNNQSFTDSRIGSANYDVGHVFHSGSFNGISGGGIGIVGRAGLKAQAATSGTPNGDTFYIDYVAHEMGHQFGGRHNFNNCSGSQGDSPVFANEPGSGSTIMGYAGICGSTNIQAHSDAYFNYLNLNQINNYINGGLPQGLAPPVATTNNRPEINPLTNYTIPDQTPFKLTATGVDIDGDTVTYTWEQANTGSGPIALGTDPGSGPIIRSRPGSTTGERMIPPRPNVLNGTLPIGETLPLTNRTLNFTVTARDNRAGEGGVAQAGMVVTSVNAGTGFMVTSPNSTGITWPGGSQQTVTWNLSGSNVAPINTANVRILLSTDGGNTFPTVLAASTPNDGSELVQMPFNVGTSSARIMIEAVDNIFFDISNFNFIITNVTQVNGDFNGDGNLDCEDVDALSLAIATGSTNLLYDVTGDSLVNGDDLDFWVVDLKQTLLGDANLDFVVDGLDFTAWNAHKFTTETAWCNGNFNGDNVVDGLDFTIWNQFKFQSAAAKGAFPLTLLPATSSDQGRVSLHRSSLTSAQPAEPVRLPASAVDAILSVPHARDSQFAPLLAVKSTEHKTAVRRELELSPSLPEDSLAFIRPRRAGREY